MAKSYMTLIDTRHGYLWIMLPDSIDMDNYLKIEQNILAGLDRTPIDVVLDFSHTKTLFSSGIGMVVRLKKLVNDRKLNIFLVALDSKIKEGLENVGLESIFEIYLSEEAFVKARGNI